MDDADLEWRLEAALAELDSVKVAVEEVRAVCARLMGQLAGRDLTWEDRLRRALIDQLGQAPHDRARGLEVYVSVSKKLGPVAARVFESCLVEAELPRDGRRALSVGISGGRTIKEMMECIEGGYGGTLWLIPLSGSRLPPDAAISVNTIIGQFCSQPGRGNVRGLQLPLDPRLRRQMRQEQYDGMFGTTLNSYYLNIGERGEDDPPPVNYAFTGIGSIDPTGAIPRLVKLLEIPVPEGRTVPDGIVGDMLDWPISDSGMVVGKYEKINQAIVGIRPDRLQDGRQDGNLTKVVVVAGSDGVEVPKDEAILAAWKGGLFDVLVTDVYTAKLIVDRVYGGH